MDRLLIVLPAFNAASTVAALIGGIRNAMQAFNFPYQILLVDDGSTDATANIARTFNVECLSHGQNQGKGAALITGFTFAMANGFGWVLTMDADLQHPPESIPDFINAWSAEQPDILIGCRRFSSSKMPLIRRISNRLTSVLISLRVNHFIADAQSGFRLIRCSALSSIRLRTTHYETETELLIRLAKHRSVIRTITIPTVYNSETSHIRYWTDTWRFIKMYLTT